MAKHSKLVELEASSAPQVFFDAPFLLDARIELKEKRVVTRPGLHLIRKGVEHP